jgi:hypothetical protein
MSQGSTLDNSRPQMVYQEFGLSAIDVKLKNKLAYALYKFLYY